MMRLDPPQLHTAHRRLVAGHPEVEAGLLVKEAGLAEREVPQQAQPLGQPFVVRGDHPALAGRDDLVRVEREAAHVAERTGHATADRCAVRLGAVLDHGESVPRRDLDESVHVDRMTEEMDRDDRARARRDRAPR